MLRYILPSKRITVVEDDRALEFLYTMILMPPTYKVQVFNGLTDLDEIKESIIECDLVVSDYLGVAFDDIKKLCRKYNRPLLLVSAVDNINSLHDHVLKKPFGYSELRRAINRLIKS
jgi:DNA-binding response OmpR family regulator